MRATGKTFRAVLRALADASEGKFVVFVSRVKHDPYPQAYASFAASGAQEAVFFRQANNEFVFRSGDQSGCLRLTYLEAFTQDVREGRYSGVERTKFKVVFDDCGPDHPYVAAFLQERAHG